MDESKCLFVEMQPWEAGRIRDKFEDCGELMDTSLENIRRFKQGNPQNLVSSVSGSS